MKRLVAVAVAAFLIGTHVHGYGIRNGSLNAGVYADYYSAQGDDTCHTLGVELIGNVGFFKDEC